MIEPDDSLTLPSHSTLHAMTLPTRRKPVLRVIPQKRQIIYEPMPFQPPHHRLQLRQRHLAPWLTSEANAACCLIMLWSILVAKQLIMRLTRCSTGRSASRLDNQTLDATYSPDNRCKHRYQGAPRVSSTLGDVSIR
jgi:hypothetical protein